MKLTMDHTASWSKKWDQNSGLSDSKTTLFWQHSWHLNAKRFLPVNTSYSWLIPLIIQSLGTSLSGGLLCHLREGVNSFLKGGSRSWAFRIA